MVASKPAQAAAPGDETAASSAPALQRRQEREEVAKNTIGEEHSYMERDSDDDGALFGEVDALFDEHADSEDEAWVREQLLGGSSADDGTDSVSCPSCFALLSMQCQPHVRYDGQFRALFVTNCRVVTKETLQVRVNVRGVRGRDGAMGECFRPVECKKCGTEVAVLDREGVYHFCNVVY